MAPDTTHGAALDQTTGSSRVFSLQSSQGRELPTDRVCTALPGELVTVRYDLDRIRSRVSRRDITQGPASLWRYSPLLPLDNPQQAISLGEGYTPLVPAPRLGAALGLARLAV